MKREEKSAVSRQRILTAAMEEISRKGYEGASLSTLCAEKEISTLGELISAAEENMGNEPVPVRITDPKLDPDTMNRALQQVGGGYLYCGLNKDATAIVCSAPWNMSVEDCLSALAQADALAESVVSQLITGDMSDLEKAEALYAWVTANVEYDQRYYSDRNAMPYESQTALGALRDGIAICGGYSHAVKRRAIRLPPLCPERAGQEQIPMERGQPLLTAGLKNLRIIQTRRFEVSDKASQSFFAAAKKAI